MQTTYTKNVHVHVRQILNLFSHKFYTYQFSVTFSLKSCWNFWFSNVKFSVEKQKYQRDHPSGNPMYFNIPLQLQRNGNDF